MRWIWISISSILLLIVLFLVSIHAIWGQQFPEQEQVQAFVKSSSALKTIDNVDRNTGRVPCYVLHGVDGQGKPAYVFATPGHILAVLHDSEGLPQQGILANADKIIPGFTQMRMNPGILVQGTGPVDPNNLNLNPADPSWHFIWEVFGYQTVSTSNQKQYYLLDLDAKSGQMLRQYSLSSALASQ